MHSRRMLYPNLNLVSPLTGNDGVITHLIQFLKRRLKVRWIRICLIVVNRVLNGQVTGPVI